MALAFNTDPVEVVNEALGQLGKADITDLNDTTDTVAVKAKRYFLSLLRTMLRDHDWNFARARRTLAQNAAAPESEYSYAYALPDDCLFVRQMNGTDHPSSQWKIEGRDLITNDSTVIIKYTRWIDDPNIWCGSFHQAFVTLLAVRFAPAFDVDNAKASDLYKVHQMQLFDAKAIDGAEGSLEQIQSTALTSDIREE